MTEFKDCHPQHFKKIALALLAACVAIPAIGASFYLTYRIVTFLGN